MTALSTQTSTRPLTGEARIAGNLIVTEGTSFDFGLINNGFAVQQLLNVNNTGGLDTTALDFLNLSSPFQYIGGGFPGTGGNCSTTISALTSCTLAIEFRPTATADYNVSATLSYHDGFGTQSIPFNLVGRGFANTVSLSRTSPGSSPNTTNSPTIRVNNLVTGARAYLHTNSNCTSISINSLSTGGSVDFNPTVNEGSHTFYARTEDESGNFSTCSVASASYTYDNTTPNGVTSAVMSQTFVTSNTISPTFNWSHSTSGDADNYEAGLSINPAGGNDVAGWNAIGLVTNHSFTGLSLSECTYYYASVRVIDLAGLLSSPTVASPAFRYDSQHQQHPALSVSIVMPHKQIRPHSLGLQAPTLVESIRTLLQSA